MAPKKPKETADDFWRTRIEDAKLNDDDWQVEVVMVEAAGSDQDRIYLNKFEIFAAEEKRFVIKNICKTETIFMINQLGSEKKVKDDNLRVFEEGNSYLKDKKDIPPEIQALIIKHLILKMKDEYLFIRRQKLEVKEGMRRESATMIDRAEVRGTVSVKPLDPPAPVTVKGKGKKVESDPSTVIPEPDEGKKYNTTLRVRGEEWRDKVYVDDFPTDGPNLYVGVTGFMEPFLAGCLTKIGIPLIAIVQIRIDLSTTKVPSSLFRGTKRGQSQTEIQTEKTLKFWEDLQQLRIQKDFRDDFKNTAFIVFSPPYWDSESLSGSPDKIYDEICYLLYDIQDLKRQHSHFLEKMDIISIPDEIGEERLKQFYNHTIYDIPLECVTTYSILDSILQSVCHAEEEEKSASKSSFSDTVIPKPFRNSKANDKTEVSQKFVQEVFNTLCKTDADRKAYRVTYGEEYENIKDPLVINYGDLAKYPTFHLGNINLDNVIWSTLFGMPINMLWLNQGRPGEVLEAKLNFHVNVLLSCFDRPDIETAELNRLIHILACRKLYNNRSSLKKHHLQPITITEFKKMYLKRSVLAEPLPKCPSIYRCSSSASPSFPSMTKSENDSENMSEGELSEDAEVRRTKFLFDCPDLSELISAAEIANEQPINHMIDDYEFFEDFTGINAFQVMLEAFNKFNCVDYKYCEVTDCIVLMMFNSHDKEGIAREEWRSHLPTPLCLQDFFDFVLEEHYTWIQNEEKIYDEKMTTKSQSDCKDLIDPYAVQSCLDDTDIELELLIEGSLKYQEFAQVEESSAELTSEKTSSKKKESNSSPASSEADSKSSRKTKSPLVTPKNLKHSFVAIVPSTDIPKKPFLGYDLGDRRVEVFGKDSIFFSKDGTRLSSLYTLLIPMNLEYIILNVVPGNGNNEFWLHRALGEFVPVEVLDACESFRITSKDQVMINIKKQSYQTLPVLPQTNEIPKAKETTQNGKSPTSKSNQGLPELPEANDFYSFHVTWPNGLITESVHENNAPEISHIKQYYTSGDRPSDEKMRCISLNGEVIVFKKSGEILVMRPDGTYFIITKCERRLVVPEVIEDFRSDTSSDKSKKGKSKEKIKDKASRVDSKSFKNVTDDDVELNLPEYKLFIDEFEMVDQQGLRLKWVNDNCIKIERLLVRTATDFSLDEIFSRKMGGTYNLLKRGRQIFTFRDKTRISSEYIIEEDEIFPEWTDEEKEYFDMIMVSSDTLQTDTNKSKGSISPKSYLFSASGVSSSSKKIEEEETKVKVTERTDGYVSVHMIYTIEHENFTSVTINNLENKMYVASPNGSRIVIDNNNHHYDIILDNETSAQFNGEVLHINYEACSKCQSFTLCDIIVKNNKRNENENNTTDSDSDYLLKMKDSFCTKIIVNKDGNISLLDEPCSSESLHTDELPQGQIVEPVDINKSDTKYEGFITSHGKCRNVYQAKTIRFFVLRRELTCSELVHRTLVEQYKSACKWQPWCSINQYDTFGDHRALLSILTPVHLTETEKWLMDSKYSDKPKYLTYKDLKKDCGKGFYHWMRPYGRFEPNERKPENVLPPRQPRAFILRTLEQQWNEKERDKFKGARELLAAIIKYRQILQLETENLLQVPIIDPREEDERQIDDIIQALGHRMYEDLKVRLGEEAATRAQTDITTRPLPVPEEMLSVEGEMVEEIDEIKTLEEQRASLLKELDNAEKMSPNLEKYWRHRAEELKEEEFYKYLLREGSVPPYFRNVLGGAIWSEMNDTADEAITKAEGRKMKCVCNDGSTSGTDSYFTH